MAPRFYEALAEVAANRIRRGIDYVYRRNHGLGRVCDTIVYSLEQRKMIILGRDGGVSLTPLGETTLRDHRNENPEEEDVDADHS